MYKILIAVDSFKGSLSSSEAGKIIAEGLKQRNKNIICEVLPMADGGEGTVEAVMTFYNGKIINVTAKDPIGKEINTFYGIFDNGNSAIIETAAVIGLNLLKAHERNPMVLNTFGVGQLMLDAVNKGCRKLYLGLGGSATNDAGLGMAAALGIKFTDKENRAVEPIPRNIGKITNIDFSEIEKNTKNSEVVILSDVKNVLCGKEGAANVFAKQKGADDIMVAELDKKMEYISGLIEESTKRKVKLLPGSGAAGGLGFGLLSFTNSKMLSGAQFIIDQSDIKTKISSSDLVITGEGKLDFQSEFGKLPIKIAEIAERYNKKCICIAGAVDEAGERLKGKWFDEIYSIVNERITLNDAIENAAEYLKNLASNIEI